jgi:Fe2+ transport system protein B
MARRPASPRAASPAPATTGRLAWQQKLDRLLTNPWTAFPIMVAVLGVILWLTIVGANVPSSMLATLLVDQGHALLSGWFVAAGSPPWLKGLLVDGMYLATAWVIAVMLPPMAIFFPCFTLLEDFGFLPRVAFNLDRIFQKAGAHGKQALTMAMGLGCNAAGVVATRIIDSPRERLIAILTNNFSLCNGRWPTQILMAGVFIGALAPAGWGGSIAALSVLVVALLGFGFRPAHLLAAGPHGAARRGHQLQPGTAALPTAEFLENPLHLAHRPHPDRAVARRGLRPARRRGHLACPPMSCWRPEPRRMVRPFQPSRWHG